MTHDYDAMLSDLEWRRVRRRVAMHPAIALLHNCATVVLILMIRAAAGPAIAR